VLLSAFAFQAVEAERRARLADRALRLEEKGQALAREFDGALRQAVLDLRADVGTLDPGQDLATEVAPVVSRLVAGAPFFTHFFLLDSSGQRAYPAVLRHPRLRRWPEPAAESLGGVAGALLWRSPARLLPALADEGGERALRLQGRLAHGASEAPVRAAALWDLATAHQARADRPGIFGALEAYRELANMPLGLVDARGRNSPAEARLRLALAHRLLKDRAAYLGGLRRLIGELHSGAYQLPAATLEELAESAASHLEYEGLGDEAVAEVRALTARRRQVEEQFNALEDDHGAILNALLREAETGPATLLSRPGQPTVVSYALLPPAPGQEQRALVALCLDRGLLEQALRDQLARLPNVELAAASPDRPPTNTPDLQEVPLSPPLAHMVLRVHAPANQPTAVEDALNLPRDTVYLWAIMLSIVGIAAGVLVTTRTVRREAKAAQLKSDWVANVTHELKTPLTSIQMFLETLQLGRVSDEAEAKECLDVMSRESERLSRLIEQLLVFSRLDSRKPRLKLAFVDPGALVDEAISLLADQLNQPDPTSLGIEVVSVQDLPHIGVDRFAMVQAILNLLQNAWKYAAGPDRKVRVVLTSRRRHVEIAVEDNGIGVPRRDRKRIFVKFERASNAEKGQIQGSGIGLTLANQIVKAHWGRIDYAPLKPNGSRFSVLLPK
jgi:signal transduction histidine kinase